MQVKFINSAINAAPCSSTLHALPHVSDPCDGIVEVLIKCMEWNLTTSRRVIPGCIEWESEVYRGVMMPTFQDAQAHLSKNESAGKRQDNLGYPLILSFCSQSDRDNPRYPCMCRIAA